jgi:hypothetical protein
MTSESGFESHGRNGTMRRNKWLAKCLSLSTLLAAAGVLGAGGMGCAEETFAFCECRFTMPPECLPTDPAVVASEFILCTGRDEEYTYEECGVYCKNQVPAILALTPEVIGPTARPPITCSAPVAMPQAPVETLAKNSCSVGTPVGE